MFFYNLIIRFYYLAIYLASPFHAKAKLAVKGRKNFFKIHTADKYKEGFIWFHVASLGEFEQGRPLLEMIRKEHPTQKILLSFFSPSGYEVRKNYECADVVVYLPFDTKSNARKFLNAFPIEMAIFVKSELWPFYIKALFSKRIPTYLVSATLKEKGFYFKWYGRFFKKLLGGLNQVYVQDKDSEERGLEHGLKNITLSGDMRIDRVLTIKENCQVWPELNDFLGNKKAIIFGSIYPHDEPLMDAFIAELKGAQPVIIVPHEVGASYILHLKKKYSSAILFSDLKNWKEEKILIIDNIGMLNSLYKIAQMAYIGCGFGWGIHSVLEPAVFGIPVFYGPHHQNSLEAQIFIKEKMGFSSKNYEGLCKLMITSLLNLESAYFHRQAEEWFSKNAGATALIFNDLKIQNSRQFNAS